MVIKFKDEADIVKQANDTIYDLASAVFSRNIKPALGNAHKVRAKTVWVNAVNMLYPNVPFGDFKHSGVGRQVGEYTLGLSEFPFPSLLRLRDL